MTDHFDHTEEVIADLQAAKEYLLEHGWCQGSLVTDEGKACAVGAIRATVMGSPLAHEAFHEGLNDRVFRTFGALVAVLPRMRAELPAWKIEHWNDAMVKSPHDVIEAFDRAIIKLKENRGD